MADEMPKSLGGSRSLIILDASSKEGRNIHSVTSDGVNRVAVSADIISNSGNISVNILPLTGSILATVVSVTTSATKLPSTPLSGRKVLAVKNSSVNVIFIGSSAVTTANGYPLQAESATGKDDGGEIILDVDDTIDIYGIAGGTSDVRVLEIS